MGAAISGVITLVWQAWPGLRNRSLNLDLTKKAIIIAFIYLVLIVGQVHAHLKSDPGVPCFRMVDHQVQEIENTLSQSPYAEIVSVSESSAWVPELGMGDALNLNIQFRVALCRPFMVFVHPVMDYDRRVRIMTSPSPAFEPGEYMGEHSAFIKIELADEKSELQSFAISGVRVSIEEYGSGKKLVEFNHPLSASWITKPSLLDPGERCSDDHRWPPQSSPARQCENAAEFALSSGFRVKDKLDLNADGICELLVEVESCRKLNNNICYKVYEENNGSYRELWQYYNELLFFEANRGFLQLGSTETGPYQKVHRFGRYDPLRRRYVTERILQPCRGQ